jgi:hypothetical protein
VGISLESAGGDLASLDPNAPQPTPPSVPM